MLPEPRDWQEGPAKRPRRAPGLKADPAPIRGL